MKTTLQHSATICDRAWGPAGGCCPSCGAPGVCGLEGCAEIFQRVLATLFSTEALSWTRRLIVDAYSLQHPEQYMRSSKSAAAHLIAMCWSMEYGRTQTLHRAVKRYVDGPQEFERVAYPPQMRRGRLTVRHVLDAVEPEICISRAEEWARSAWNAWEDQHDRARLWVKEALAVYEQAQPESFINMDEKA